MLSLEKTYYVTQIVAVIALIVSLLYVGRQIQQNTHEMQLGTNFAAASQWIQVQGHVVQSPEFSDLMLRSETDFASLNPSERARIMAFISSWAVMSETDWIAAEQGVFLGVLTAITTDWKIRLRLPAYREYFNEYGSRHHTPEFVQFIDSLIQENAS